MDTNLKKLIYQYLYKPWGRCYQINGKEYPGITTVLDKTKPLSEKMALQQWRKSLGDSYSEVSQGILSRGSNWHKYLETRYGMKNELAAKALLESDIRIQAIAEQCKPLLKRMTEVKIMGFECPVKSDRWGYAGTFDMLIESDRQITLLDWKTSSKPKEEKYVRDYKLQLAAYSSAISECYGLPIHKACVVVFYDFKQPDYFSLDSDGLKTNFEAFLLRLEQFYASITQNLSNT